MYVCSVLLYNKIYYYDTNCVLFTPQNIEPFQSRKPYVIENAYRLAVATVVLSLLMLYSKFYYIPSFVEFRNIYSHCEIVNIANCQCVQLY